jgi:hypothetical protein
MQEALNDVKPFDEISGQVDVRKNRRKDWAKANLLI